MVPQYGKSTHSPLGIPMTANLAVRQDHPLSRTHTTPSNASTPTRPPHIHHATPLRAAAQTPIHLPKLTNAVTPTPRAAYGATANRRPSSQQGNPPPARTNDPRASGNPHLPPHQPPLPTPRDITNHRRFRSNPQHRASLRRSRWRRSWRGRGREGTERPESRPCDVPLPVRCRPCDARRGAR